MMTQFSIWAALGANESNASAGGAVIYLNNRAQFLWMFRYPLHPRPILLEGINFIPRMGMLFHPL